MRKHKLFPKYLMKKIPALYSQENVKDPIVHASYFTLFGSARWLVTEADPEEGTLFGFAEVLPGCGELGYMNMQEMEEAKYNGVIPAIERDLYFEPAPLSEVKKRLGLD